MDSSTQWCSLPWVTSFWGLWEDRSHRGLLRGRGMVAAGSAHCHWVRPWHRHCQPVSIRMSAHCWLCKCHASPWNTRQQKCSVSPQVWLSDGSLLCNSKSPAQPPLIAHVPALPIGMNSKPPLHVQSSHVYGRARCTDSIFSCVGVWSSCSCETMPRNSNQVKNENKNTQTSGNISQQSRANMTSESSTEAITE